MPDTSLWLLEDPPRPVDPATPLLRADDLGVLRGESVFETVRVAGGRARFLGAHLDRLARSAERVDVELAAGWQDLAEQAVAGHGQGDAVLRLVASKGGTSYALLTPVPRKTVEQREQGVAAVTLPLGVPADLRRQAPWLLGGVKSTSYAVNMASMRAAEAQGAQDAVWTSSDGFVLEAPTSTVLWWDGDRWVTPDPDDVGTLAGTTLAVVEGLAPVAKRRGTVQELHGADEVALLSSVRGVAPVYRLDGRDLPSTERAEALRAAFEKALLEG